MLKLKPQHHPLLVPTLSFLLLVLVIMILVLAAYTNNISFWIASVLFDLGISFIGAKTILKLRKPILISKPLGDQLKYGERLEGEEEPEVVKTE
ncbi:MAG: hypothetical protein KAU62_00030 [Candidatus Heimdallarchaeota archaeon]|nr:hypothetical protein [Candidatus Heimdallarchaeota archaeon]MCG3254432.1 hypothetical protein [Candidatus Heimdallarchaeota archaeon]MCK4609517.1 hypothetical protein [Candidatus Heimdallarchaeota archaeon]